jgi:hypothetical protein
LEILRVKEIWAEKEQGLDNHQKIYETWNEKYIPLEMRNYQPR